jgi:hypothetical protein
MFFTKKTKKIILDCYTSFNHAHDFYPIAKAKDHIPQWWKNLPATYNDTQSLAMLPTMKTCAGFNMLYKEGFIMPLWTDTTLSTRTNMMGSGTGVAQFADNITNVDVHKPIQWGDHWNPKEYTQLKIASPWAFKCSEEISWAWTAATWNFDHPEDIIILPGVMEWKYQTNTHINVFIKKYKNGTDINSVYLPAGQPMIHFFPLTEREVEVRNHLVTHTEFNKIYGESNHPFHLNSYGRTKKMKKELEGKQSKCPFSNLISKK